MPHPIADLPILVASALLLLSLLASKYGGRLGLPGLLLFLVIGMLAGSDGPGGIPFEDYALAQFVGTVALVFILFTGGYETHWKKTKPVLKAGLSLATLGVLLTTALVGVGAHFLFDLPWLYALLLGAVVSSTDASAVFSVLRERALKLKSGVRPLLEFESGVNDPTAIFLVLGLTTLAVEPGTGALSVVPMFFRQMLIGLVAGYLLGRVSVFAFERLQFVSGGLYAVLSIAIVGLVYSATALLGGSGFLAVYVAGVVLGHARLSRDSEIRSFHDGFVYLLEIGMFLLLGLLVFPSQLVPIALPALALSLLLMFVARPIAVYASLALSPMRKRHKSFVAWVGLRGAVPIVLATFPMLAGAPYAQLIFNVAFFIVLTSILVQGTTLAFAARVLHIADVPEPGEEAPPTPDLHPAREG